MVGLIIHPNNILSIEIFFFFLIKRTLNKQLNKLFLYKTAYIMVGGFSGS